jgi:uncharacterized protein YndB with AHSA1/START domain
MQAETPNDDTQVQTSRLLSTPVNTVWKAITTPELLAQWWGPDGFTNTFEHIEIKPDGAWNFVMRGPDGSHFKNESTFEEVIDQERIVIRHISHPKFRLTISLTENESKTLVDWIMVFDNASDLERARAIVIPANEQNLNRLERVLSEL